MSDKNELIHQQTIMVSELLIKVTALENALITKGFINVIDVADETTKIVIKLAELMKQNIEKSVTQKNSGD